MRKAFTIIELLVVIAIITLVMALLFVAVMKARESASKTAYASNLHQIDLTQRMYMQDWPNAHLGMNWKPLLPYLDDKEQLFHCPASKLTAQRPMFSIGTGCRC